MVLESSILDVCDIRLYFLFLSQVMGITCMIQMVCTEIVSILQIFGAITDSRPWLECVNKIPSPFSKLVQHIPSQRPYSAKRFLVCPGRALSILSPIFSPAGVVLLRSFTQSCLPIRERRSRLAEPAGILLTSFEAFPIRSSWQFSLNADKESCCIFVLNEATGTFSSRSFLLKWEHPSCPLIPAPT